MLLIKGGEMMPQKKIIPTPSFGINYALGGGFWTGRFHLVWGNFSSGKTTFLLHTLAAAQKMGYTPVIIDSEGSYTDEWGEKCGINLSDRIYIKSNITEEVWEVVQPMIKSNIKYAFLVDSINTIQSANFFDDKGGIASGARSRNKLITLLSEYTHPENNIIFVVAQQTNDLSGQHARVVAKTGHAEGHICTNIVRLRGSNAKDALKRMKNDMIVNKEVTWTVEKCKQSPVEGMSGHYWFNPQNAFIDRTLELLDIAVYNGVIKQSASWFKYKEHKFQGMSALRDGVTELKLIDQIASELTSDNLKLNDGSNSEEEIEYA